MADDIEEDTEADGEIETEEDNRVQSKKIEVIDDLYGVVKARHPDGPWVVTNEDVVAAINRRNKRHPEEKKGLSNKNPANFLKDFIRKQTCNTNWPKALKDARITARQRYGGMQVMEFVEYLPDDSDPFPDRFNPSEDMLIFPYESLSIPVEARALGRADEPWLIQVVVSQRLLHLHFATVAREAGLRVDTLAHLQMSVKTQPEMDATFVANVRVVSKGEATKLRAYVTCEAKQFKERILEFQIREQVAKAFDITAPLEGSDAIGAVIPTAFQIVKYPVEQPGGAEKEVRGIYIVQFKMIMRDEYDQHYRDDNLHAMPLEGQSRAFYEACPPIEGISTAGVKKGKRKKSA